MRLLQNTNGHDFETSLPKTDFKSHVETMAYYRATRARRLAYVDSARYRWRMAD